MPIADRPAEEPSTAAVIVGLFREIHRDLRALVMALDAAGLDYVPCAGANSIATIVTHTLGSEAETLCCVAGLESSRDRDAEFRRGAQRRAELLDQLDAADDLLEATAPALTPERLRAAIALPTLSPDDRRPGIAWLVGNVGHAREHVGHAMLTEQLFDARATR